MAIIRINAPLHFANAEICMGKAMNLLRSVRPSLVPYPKLKVNYNDSKCKLLSQSYLLLKGGKSDALPSVKGTSEAMKLHSLRLEGVTSDGNIEENLVLLVKEEPVKSVILDMVAVAFVDITGVRVLQKFGKDCLAEHGCQLAFSGCLGTY
jgi:MFS superfamily sulfate permease-like transporter